MAVLLDQFVETLSQSGLMTAGEVQAFLDGLGADERPETGEELAKLLVRQGKLTRFQAQCIYQGKTKGLVFDEYTVLDKIGQGGMGVVLKAQHRRMKRLVAVKMLPTAALKNEDAVRRFYREVEAAARLTHPNIVTAYDAREHAGTHCLVMEYVEGKDLAELVAERGPLPVGQAVNCVIQTAKGLEYAHKQGIIHRDIKPSNLLLDREGTVKILDMGLARIFEGGDAAGSDRLTGSGQVMGTCDYMAPEQAEDTRGADHRADVYSLGCTLYRLLTGEKPYQGDTMIQVLMAHRAAEIPSARDARSDVPEPVDGVCRKMMAKAPEDRYQSMTEALAALETCVAVKAPVPAPVADEPSRDSELTAFLQSLPKESIAARQKAARVAEDTLKSQEQQDTSSNIWTKLVPADRRQMWTYAGIAAGAAFLVVLLGVILMLRTPEGTLVVEVNEPDALVQVFDEEGKVEIDLRNDKGTISLGVDPGKHRLRVEKDGFQFYTEDFTMESGGKVTIAAKLAPLEDEGAGTTNARQDAASATPRQVVEDSPAPQDADEGFVSLFDGKSLVGWQGATEAYAVEGGNLVSTRDGRGALFTTKEYGDFIFRFEFKLEPDANNGALLRAPLGGKPATDCIEIQILDDSSPKHAGLDLAQYHGSIYQVAPAQRGYLRPCGLWNSQEILCRSRQVQVTLNNTTILDVDLDGLGPDALQKVPGLQRDTGYVGFLAHRSRVEFRSIRIKELTGRSTQPSLGNRVRWVKESGLVFLRLDDGTWQEHGENGKTYYFTESLRTEAFVELAGLTPPPSTS